MAVQLLIRVLLLTSMAVIPNQFGTAKASADIGVCYGMLGNNLPPATEVINLYKHNNIGKIRLFDPDPSALQALRGSEIDVTVGIRNEDLAGLASNQDAVASWFAAHVEPYLNDIVFSNIAVGNEVIPGHLGQYVLPVMESLQAILDHKNLAGIKLTTVLPANALALSYPPSAAQFSDEAANDLRGIIRFMSTHGAPLMINVYPYFAYASDPVNVRLDYALFTATAPVVQDGNLSYHNMFDAIVDAFFWATEREGVSDVNIVVAESGWPSAGNGGFTTPELASTYAKNFVNHILSNAGTPKRPGPYVEGFIFAMFNENLKPAGVEQNFGLFYPNMNPVYPVF
ncbi:probable glucan endo-1,3-beta-glucosidase BG4 [Morus notabilis]|uniref:probable glucan endo-1,3-beta-glucosidase BG4 n=1 Tax=Morus notabilis TaxID=981085 RepID=UPI000CED6849|nr:probable glucan endo-1,3-beta-glucosidase BG4 [Morus notabilis]